jgi:uncharacterized damage-inducible protein DinB
MSQATTTQPVLTAQDLIAWNEKTSTNWQELLTHHPELLTLPCDVAGAKTLGELLQHIVAVELRYAERLANLPTSDYANIPFDSVASIYSTHDRAFVIFQQLLVSPDINWDEPFEFLTRSMGPARSNRKTILFHALLHGIRHYAQLATLVRQHGINPVGLGDYLVMNLERI